MAQTRECRPAELAPDLPKKRQRTSGMPANSDGPRLTRARFAAQYSAMLYPRFEPMVDSARQHAEIWRVIVGTITVLAFAILWTGATFILAARFLQPVSLAGETAIDTLLFLSTIAGGFGLGTWIAARILHRRGLGSLIGRAPRALRDFAIAAALTWSVAAIVWLVMLPVSEPLQPNLPFGEWLRWLPLAAPLILVQTGAEELFFRGYLQSQFAARFRAIWVWLLIPSLMFGALHYLPSDSFGPRLIYVGVTALFGVAAADLTARTGSIGAAWGLHFANNCIAILAIVYLGAASGLGLYAAGTIEDALTLSPLLIIDVVLLVSVWFLIRRALCV